jgi:hypothetical protein
MMDIKVLKNNNNMRHIYKILFAFALVILFNSCRDELDQLAKSDFAPGILSASPSDGGSAAKSKFEIKIVFVDGAVSPLLSATVTLSDTIGNEILSVTRDLSGTKDSIVIEKATLAALDLPISMYNLSYSAQDTKGQRIDKSFDFSLTPLDFPANNLEMYMAGSFNGWGWDELTLVGDNLWEVKEVTLDGGEWKFKNTKDWTDKDWGDGSCSGKVVETTGGGANSNCGHSGLVNVTFNDRTLVYTIKPSVLYEQNIASLFLLGTINNFTGSDYEFSQTADNTWFLEGIHLMPEDQFKFSEKSDFSGVNFGDDEMDGKVEMYGNNMVLAGDFTEGLYSITFNDKSRLYTIDFVKYTTIGIIGDATIGVTGGDGWANDADMTDNGDGTFSIVIPLTVGSAKFRNGNAWNLNWGGSTFPTGTTSGDNIPVNSAGLYNVTFNPTTGEYSFVLAELYKIGSFNGWTPGLAASFSYVNGVFEYRAEATIGEAFKFFGQQDWGPTEYAYSYFSSFPADISDDGGNMKYNGATREYLYIVDVEAKTFSLTKSGLFKVGSENGWNDPSQLREFTETSPGVYEYIETLVANEEFKFVDTDGSWSHGIYGAGQLTVGGSASAEITGGDNFMYTGTGGTYTLVVDLNASTMTIN